MTVDVAHSTARPTESEDSPAPHRVVEVDAARVELARTAAVEESERPDLVGEYLGAFAEDDVAVTLRFARTDRGYRGWEWSVTLAVLDGAEPTISEVVLLPGEDALLAPAWLPWAERVRPGDLGPGDLLPPAENDIRLVPAYLQSDDPAVEEVAHELGIGRVRVLSREGRSDAAQRWHDGEFGPNTEMARQAPLNCVMCAFYLPLAGSLGAVAGACGNEMSPADGRIVDPGYGCGAHSELVIAVEPSPVGRIPIDDTVLDVHPRVPGERVPEAEPETEAEAEAEAEAVAEEEVEAVPAGGEVVTEDQAADAETPDQVAPQDAASEPSAADQD